MRRSVIVKNPNVSGSKDPRSPLRLENWDFSALAFVDIE
jgi:hypothetical protein